MTDKMQEIEAFFKKEGGESWEHFKYLQNRLQKLGWASSGLSHAIKCHIVEIDELMKGPASYERGQKIARSISRLQAFEEKTQKDLKAQDAPT